MINMKPEELKLQRKEAYGLGNSPRRRKRRVREETAEFTHAIIHKTPSPITAEDGRRALEIVQNTYND